MAKLLGIDYVYKLYPKKHVKCSCCHREFVSEPFIKEYHIYRSSLKKERNRCWRCVRSREAVDLIYNKWPGLYMITKKGGFYYLSYAPAVVELFARLSE